MAKANSRDRKRNKRKYGHQVDGRSILTIQQIQREKAESIRKAREEKEKLLEIPH